MPQRGFTLIELMLVLVIAALLMLLAAPAFSTFMARQQLAGDVNQLQSVLTMCTAGLGATGPKALKRTTRRLLCA
ncbi:MAG: prepilin-type N-terminal cleavage/methylation domain-containing protein [Halomonas sp.]|nr:prepilin-type N-terminal cleavage/methylation domain-containing protein [Halomonas sp.]